MGGIIVIGVMACAVGAVMRVPASDAVPGANVTDPARAAARAGTSSSRVDYMSGDVILDRQDDGHFYAMPSINMMPVHTLVDTGASVVVLTGIDAESLGLSWNANDVHPVGQGASGAVMGVRTTLDSVELGAFEAYNVPAVIVPEGLQISLLGQSFLERVPDVAISEGEMRLSGQ